MTAANQEVSAPAAPVAPPTATAAPETQVSAEEAKTRQDASAMLQSLKWKYWGPPELNDGITAIGAITAAAQTVGMAVKYSFDTSAEFPHGYGIAVAPISARTEQRGNVTHTILVAAIPSPELVAEDERGRAFMHEACVASFVKSVTGAVRPRADGSTAATVPFTLDEFLTKDKGPSLATYRKLAPLYVGAIRKQGLAIITPPILRQCLTSAQFAAQQFPTTAREKWERVLGKMIAKAEAHGMDPGIMLHWRETRDSVDIDVGDFDTDALDEVELDNA